MTTATPPVHVPRERRWYKSTFLWIFLAIQVIFLIWIIGAGSDASGAMKSCAGLSTTVPANEIFSAKEQCEMDNAAVGAGTGIGIALVIGLWLAVDFILGLSYGIFRLAKRR